MIFYFSSEIDYYDNGDKKSDTSIKQLTAAALIEAQFMLSDRFEFHADAGLGMFRYFKHQREWNAIGNLTKDQEYDETTFFMRPAYFGAIFYFN
jgi:hypothetical protein